MQQVIVTLTTIPSRLQDNSELAIKSCIESLVTQNYENYEVHFNIPHTSAITKNPYVIPDWLLALTGKYPFLTLYRVEDIGAITKLVPTLLRTKNPEAIIIVADDDLVYHPDMVKEQVANQEKFPGCAVGYDGLGIKNPPVFNDPRDHYVVSVRGNYEVKVLQAYKTVSYRRKFFEQDYFDTFVGKSWNDDLLNSSYLASKGIKRMVTFHPSDPILETLEQWQSLGGVQTFPVLKHTHHESLEGCNIMRHNKVDDNGRELYKHID